MTRIERQAESDDEVRSNIPPELVALFEHVKRGIKASPCMSRTEAFLHYAEENPDDVLVATEDKTDALIRELEAQYNVTAARRSGLSRGAIWVQVAPHDEGDGSEVGRARPGVAGEWAFGGRFRGGQGVSGVNAALGSIAGVRAGLRRVGGGSYGERGKAAIQGAVSSPAAGGREDATVPAGARRWGWASVGRDCHRDRIGTCPRGSRVRWIAAR